MGDERTSGNRPLVPGSVANHTACLLVKLGQVVYRLAENHLATAGLRIRHYSVLQALADNGPMSQLALGTHLRIDPATMTTTLADLENASHTTRVRDTTDRRRYVVDLTPAGREALKWADAALSALDTDALADLSPAEQRSLHETLAKLSTGPTLPTTFDEARDHPRPRRATAHDA